MDEQRELNKALNVGLFSLVGAIIPLIGLILAIVAASLASNVPSNIHTQGKKHTVQLVATIAVILALLAGFGYYSLYKNQENQAAAQEQARVEQVQKAQRDAASAKSAQESNLSFCLQQADDNYWKYVKLNATSTKETADGPVYTAYQPVWDAAENTRTTAKDECFRRYPAL